MALRMLNSHHMYMYILGDEILGQWRQYMHMHIVCCAYVLTLHVLSFSRTKWVKADGMEFKKGAGIVIGMKNDLPQIGQITSIYVIDGGTVLFRAIPFSSSWLSHFRGYALCEEAHDHHCLVYMSKLVLHTPVHIRKIQALPSSTSFIVLPHYVHVH